MPEVNMRITIIGSVSFVKSMVELYHQLKGLGHEPQMLEHMFGLADGSNKKLMSEMAEDHAATKRRLFLLNPPPQEVPYIDEIKAVVDAVLDGDLTRIQ